MTDDVIPAGRECMYWMAIRVSAGGPVDILGPYSTVEADIHREQRAQSNSQIAQLSSVFRAPDRDHAERNSRYYLQQE